MGTALRTTLSLQPRARRIAEERAKLMSISLGDAVSALIEEAEANRPQTRLEIRNGLPVFVTPPGTPKIDLALVRKAIEEDW